MVAESSCQGDRANRDGFQGCSGSEKLTSDSTWFSEWKKATGFGSKIFESGNTHGEPWQRILW